MIYVTRRETFNSAHKLYNNKWSKEKNIEMFGACANANWHGHNFELFVTVKGSPDQETGFVVDLKKLGVLIRREISEKVDHKNLNEDVDFMEGKLPSCENLIIEFWRILVEKLPQITSSKLYSLKLYETKNNYVEYFGGE